MSTTGSNPFPRPPDPPRAFRMTWRRMVLAGAVAALVLLVVSARALADFYTDYLWFRSVGFAPVWRTMLLTKIALGAGFALALFGLVWANLAIASRRGDDTDSTDGDPLAVSYQQLVGHRAGLARLGAAVLVGILGGVGMGGRWQDWLLFRNGSDVGAQDPQFGTDLGFYLFRLPFLGALVDWLFTAGVLTVLAVAAAYYLDGRIRWQVPGPHLAPRARIHLSVLLGSLAVVKAADYRLQRRELLFSTDGVVDGATYTDVSARLPALDLLTVVAVLAAGLFFVNALRRSWVLGTVAVALWGVVAVILGGIYPALIQRFRVEPAESERERRYIERNIAATREAMGLSDVAVNPLDYTEELTLDDLAENEETIRNVRLWDPAILARTYQRLQEIRGFYQFNDVDVDRYQIDGRPTQVVLSARELNAEGLPSQSWENRHLAYTHGYGAVLSPANAVTAEGQPDFLVRDVPPRGRPEIRQPAIYYGEQIPGYAIVRTGRAEIDYPKAEGELATSTYDGDGGVSIGGPIRRLAFALRFGNINPLISGFMESRSKILYLRDIRERVEVAAPFLSYDHDPYPVIIDGRILWVQDAYTTTNRYPYAQQAPTDRLPEGSGLRHRFNYVRNSVKVVIDAYHGSMDFYIIDPDDPIARAYRDTFPRLFRDGTEMPDAIRRQLRYPEDLFRVQTDVWGSYHISDPSAFYSRTDAWDVAQDPGSGEISRAGTSSGTAPVPVTAPADGAPPATTGREPRMDPYYLLMRLPDEEKEEFIQLQPFVPTSRDDSRKELSAFMVAKMDPGRYGQLETFVMPRDRQVDGPAIVNARIQQDESISSLITLLSQGGSRVLQGNLLIIPVEQSLIYVRPLYVEAEGTRVPELRKVIVVYADRVVMRDTLREGLAAIFGDAPETQEQAPTAPAPPDAAPGTVVQDTLARADQAFAEAEAALREFRLDVFQERYQTGRRLLEEARREAGP